MDKSVDLFVPGRLCLFGEHSDWAGQMRKFNSAIVPGRALVVCTSEGIYANVRPSDKLKITMPDINGSFISAEYEMSVKELQSVAADGEEFSYIAGVAAYMLNYYRIGGLELNCTKMTLPQKKGLSSSAAICTLTARAFNRIYSLNITVRGEMEAAYLGEQMTPSRCGRLDQAVAYGHGIVNMRFDGDVVDVARVKIGAPLYVVYADLKGQKDTIKILADLNSAYPYPKNDVDKNLHKLLGETNEIIVSEVCEAMAVGDLERVGELMTEAQMMFDKYAMPLSPNELKSYKLHKVLADSNIKKWVYGGKGVGSQGDGSVQFLAKSEASAKKLQCYLQNTLGLDTYNVTIPKNQKVYKSVIPVAGRGTRMLPITKIVKKDLLPVVDFDGKAKPALQILTNSLLSSGIEEICLIIKHGEEDLYRGVLGEDITFAYQDEPLGFGHAILQSKVFANGEPVLVMLGDHLFRSETDKSCITQLIEIYEHTESLTIGLFEVHLDNVPNYGIAKIIDDEFQLSGLIEKPDKKLAEAELSYREKYYGVFMYVITPEVYIELQQQIGNHIENNGEIQLTSALDTVIRKSGAKGVVIKGKRFDIGLPAEYAKTVAEYANITSCGNQKSNDYNAKTQRIWL